MLNNFVFCYLRGQEMDKSHKLYHETGMPYYFLLYIGVVSPFILLRLNGDRMFNESNNSQLQIKYYIPEVFKNCLSVGKVDTSGCPETERLINHTPHHKVFKQLLLHKHMTVRSHNE